MTRPKGDHDRRLAPRERAERNRQIVARKAEGATWEAIAAEFAISEKTARRGAKAHAEAAARYATADTTTSDAGESAAAQPIQVWLDREGAVAAVERAFGTLVWAGERLRDLGENGDSSSAKVGAVRSAVLVAREEIDLLVRTGALIDVPEAARRAAEVDRKVQEWLASCRVALERLGVDWEQFVSAVDRVEQDAREAAQDALARGRHQELIAA